MRLNDYGWNEHFAGAWQNLNINDGAEPGRVLADYGARLHLAIETGEISAPNTYYLAVGDWVALTRRPDSALAEIHCALPRKTKFSRAASGREVKEQVIAANVDTVFLVQSLNRDFNIRRLERYLIAAWESGAQPVIILSKTDCCADVADKMEHASLAAPGVPVHAVSALTGEGIGTLRAYAKRGVTVALLGSSGVGKSTLVNTLAGKEIMQTHEIRENDSRGRHTTSHRSIVMLPGGGLILDTPGMRELSLWEADTGIDAVFGDIEALTACCRFNNCGHGSEPGCAVRQALQDGSLEQKRWDAWLKLQRELAYLEAKKEGSVRLHRKQWHKEIARLQKQYKKGK